MKAWWMSRSRREQRLLQLAGAAVMVLMLLQFLIIPVLHARANARLAQQTASQTAALVSLLSSARSAIAGPVTTGQALDDDTARTQAATLAAARGLTVSRIQTGANGRFGILIDDADPTTIFAWLAESERQTGLQIASITMSETRSGRVRASIDFVRAATP